MKQIGLTGNIGSGKSTVAAWLKSRGAALIDADALAKEATQDPEVLQAIRDKLGAELVKDGQLERQKTAELVFNNPLARETLNSIIHPWVRRERDLRVAALEKQKNPPELVILDIPLLYENGLEQDLDAVIVVTAPLETRVERVQARSGLSAEDIRARDAAQLPLEEKAARADFVLDNSGSQNQLEEQLEALWQSLN